MLSFKDVFKLPSCDWKAHNVEKGQEVCVSHSLKCEAVSQATGFYSLGGFVQVPKAPTSPFSASSPQPETLTAGSALGLPSKQSVHPQGSKTASLLFPLFPDIY